VGTSSLQRNRGVESWNRSLIFSAQTPNDGKPSDMAETNGDDEGY